MPATLAPGDKGDFWTQLLGWLEEPPFNYPNDEGALVEQLDFCKDFIFFQKDFTESAYFEMLAINYMQVKDDASQLKTFKDNLLTLIAGGKSFAETEKAFKEIFVNPQRERKIEGQSVLADINKLAMLAFKVNVNPQGYINRNALQQLDPQQQGYYQCLLETQAAALENYKNNRPDLTVNQAINYVLAPEMGEQGLFSYNDVVEMTSAKPPLAPEIYCYHLIAYYKTQDQENALVRAFFMNDAITIDKLLPYVTSTEWDSSSNEAFLKWLQTKLSGDVSIPYLHEKSTIQQLFNLTDDEAEPIAQQFFAAKQVSQLNPDSVASDEVKAFLKFIKSSPKLRTELANCLAQSQSLTAEDNPGAALPGLLENAFKAIFALNANDVSYEKIESILQASEIDSESFCHAAHGYMLYEGSSNVLSQEERDLLVNLKKDDKTDVFYEQLSRKLDEIKRWAQDPQPQHAIALFQDFGNDDIDLIMLLNQTARQKLSKLPNDQVLQAIDQKYQVDLGQTLAEIYRAEPSDYDTALANLRTEKLNQSNSSANQILETLGITPADATKEQQQMAAAIYYQYRIDACLEKTPALKQQLQAIQSIAVDPAGNNLYDYIKSIKNAKRVIIENGLVNSMNEPDALDNMLMTLLAPTGDLNNTRGDQIKVFANAIGINDDTTCQKLYVAIHKKYLLERNDGDIQQFFQSKGALGEQMLEQLLKQAYTDNTLHELLAKDNLEQFKVAFEAVYQDTLYRDLKKFTRRYGTSSPIYLNLFNNPELPEATLRDALKGIDHANYRNLLSSLVSTDAKTLKNTYRFAFGLEDKDLALDVAESAERNRVLEMLQRINNPEIAKIIWNEYLDANSRFLKPLRLTDSVVREINLSEAISIHHTNMAVGNLLKPGEQKHYQDIQEQLLTRKGTFDRAVQKRLIAKDGIKPQSQAFLHYMSRNIPKTPRIDKKGFKQVVLDLDKLFYLAMQRDYDFERFTQFLLEKSEWLNKLPAPALSDNQKLKCLATLKLDETIYHQLKRTYWHDSSRGLLDPRNTTITKQYATLHFRSAHDFIDSNKRWAPQAQDGAAPELEDPYGYLSKRMMKRLRKIGRASPRKQSIDATINYMFDELQHLHLITDKDALNEYHQSAKDMRDILHTEIDLLKRELAKLGYMAEDLSFYATDRESMQAQQIERIKKDMIALHRDTLLKLAGVDEVKLYAKYNGNPSKSLLAEVEQKLHEQADKYAKQRFKELNSLMRDNLAKRDELHARLDQLKQQHFMLEMITKHAEEHLQVIDNIDSSSPHVYIHDPDHIFKVLPSDSDIDYETLIEEADKPAEEKTSEASYSPFEVSTEYEDPIFRSTPLMQKRADVSSGRDALYITRHTVKVSDTNTETHIGAFKQHVSGATIRLTRTSAPRGLTERPNDSINNADGEQFLAMAEKLVLSAKLDAKGKQLLRPIVIKGGTEVERQFMYYALRSMNVSEDKIATPNDGEQRENWKSSDNANNQNIMRKIAFQKGYVSSEEMPAKAKQLDPIILARRTGEDYKKAAKYQKQFGQYAEQLKKDMDKSARDKTERQADEYYPEASKVDKPPRSSH